MLLVKPKKNRNDPHQRPKQTAHKSTGGDGPGEDDWDKSVTKGPYLSYVGTAPVQVPTRYPPKMSAGDPMCTYVIHSRGWKTTFLPHWHCAPWSRQRLSSGEFFFQYSSFSHFFSHFYMWSTCLKQLCHCICTCKKDVNVQGKKERKIVVAHVNVSRHEQRY
jgi:hypothetical protein